jgi:hypothetical protein
MVNRFSRTCLIAVSLALSVSAPRAIGQRGGGAPAPAPVTHSPTSGNPRDRLVDMTFNSLVISGRVTLPDGSPPAQLVMVERVCKGTTQDGGFADSKGRFSFDLGVLNRSFMQRSVVEAQSNNQVAGKQINPEDLENCLVRASLSGYRSQTVALASYGATQKAQLGTLVLEPFGKEEAPALSASDAQAPKNARKEYEKGLDAAARANWQGAVDSFQKATSQYPKYASAWLSLGILQSGNGNAAGAAQSYTQAIAADDKFALPYIESAVLEDMASQWDRMAEHTAKVIQLYPKSFVRAYLLNGLANLHLQHFDLAEKSAAEGLLIDTGHTSPELEYVQGTALMGTKDVAGAAKHLEAYLALAPHGPSAAAAQKQLTALRAAR